MSKEQAYYSHGHHKSVVGHHARRTAQNSAAFLIPHIKPTDHILDVGCGPGTITCDFAALASQGTVIGGDAVEDVLKGARDLAKSRELSNVTFQKIDGNALPFEDGRFEVVFCHQVLQHVKDPVGVLKEMRRVAKPGGIVAAREADYKSFAWYPEPPELVRWGELYQLIAKANGGEPNAGRYIHTWAQQAGFDKADVQFTWNTWFYREEDAVAWSKAWEGRAIHSGFAKTAEREEFASDKELRNISKAWAAWGSDENAFIAVPNGEILCQNR